MGDGADLMDMLYKHLLSIYRIWYVCLMLLNCRDDWSNIISMENIAFDYNKTCRCEKQKGVVMLGDELENLDIVESICKKK